jgi:hypothetical protein
MIDSLQKFLSGYWPELGNLSGLPLFIFLLVAFLTLFFIAFYAVKGWQVGQQLQKAVHGVKSQKRGASPGSLASVFANEPFKHAWEEYHDTLHELKRAGGGNVAITEWRATVPAGMFFTREGLVDNRLFDDFTRHLPGILTGLGIIGTFAGLLDGLSKFDASTSAKALAGLKPLLDGVSHAFIASAIAISCAMLVTFISRLVLARFYAKAESLAQAIDGLYATGAGEEYLARLVSASEKSEAHSAQLKQALVEDLTTLMTNLVERQIEAQVTASQALGAHIGETITGQLASPIQRMTEAMESSSKGNSEAVHGMLESVLAAFMQRLEDTFGGQMRGIQDQMEQSMSSLSTVQQSLQKLVEDINRSNELATTRMSGSIDEAMKQAVASQQAMTDQLREFIQDFRKLASEEQDQSKRTMGEAVGQVLGQLKAAIEQMEGARRSAAAQELERHSGIASKTEAMVGGLSSQVGTLLTAVTDQAGAAQRQVTATLEESMRRMGENQNLLTTQMREFVSDFRRLVEEERSKSQAAMDDAVGSVLMRLKTSIEEMEKTRFTAASAEQARVEGLNSKVGTLLDAVHNQADAAQRQVTATLEESMRRMGENQNLLTTQMRDFVTDFQRLVAEEQSRSRKALDDTVGGVLEQLKSSIDLMERTRSTASDQEQARNTSLASKTEDLVSGLSAQVDSLLNSVSEQVAATQRNIDAIGTVATRAIDGLNVSALNLGSAAERFESAGNSVSGVFERSGQVTNQLAATANTLDSAANALRQGFEQYDTTRRTVDANVQALVTLIDNAKRESGLSRQMLDDLEEIVQQLRTAEMQSKQYLEGVTATLSAAFKSFGDALTNQLKTAIGETDRHLGNGVQQLTGVVQEIGVALSRLRNR